MHITAKFNIDNTFTYQPINHNVTTPINIGTNDYVDENLKRYVLYHIYHL